jgi:fructokinase
MPSQKPHILCFGEVLWDCLPDALYLGGAPANVAYHLARLGARASLVSAVGVDFLGDETLRRTARWGVDTQFVTRIPDKRTGVVTVDLADLKHPSYDIEPDAAWDYINASAELLEDAKTADGFVYGTLAARGKHNLKLLNRLLTDAAGLKAFDVNLRPPFVDRDIVLSLARRSDLIKLNEDELGVLIPGAQASGLEKSAKQLAELTGCGKVCVTCGARGAGLLVGGDWFWVDASPIEVKDTIGAGDAFLAAMIAGLLNGPQSPQDLLGQATRLAEFVATSDGATPDYTGMDLGFLPSRSS